MTDGNGKTYNQNLIAIHKTLSTHTEKLDNIEGDVEGIKKRVDEGHASVDQVKTRQTVTETRQSVIVGSLVVVGGGVTAGLLEIFFNVFTMLGK